MTVEIPEIGIVFWNVGSGDSVSIIVDRKHWLQVDLNHKPDADNADSAYAAIVDELVERLPTRNGRPYLAVFALTHPDQDHCQGFERLLDEVEIGELWFTPRVFDEHTGELCDDAVAFKVEGERRVKKTIALGDGVESGDRVRLIGYSDRLKKEPYKGFPEDKLTTPGSVVLSLDDEDLSDVFRAFIHAPFKENLYEGRDRNDTSLAMQVRLTKAGGDSDLLLFGDHSYPGLRKVFDTNKDDEDVSWGVFLSPHHCSKSAMYWADKAGDDATFRRDIMDDLEKNKSDPGYIIASAEPVPARNKKGDNPPHAKAKRRYEEIVESGHYLVTQEEPSEESPEPITFEATVHGFRLTSESKESVRENKAKVAIGSAVAAPSSPRTPQRYG